MHTERKTGRASAGNGAAAHGHGGLSEAHQDAPAGQVGPNTPGQVGKAVTVRSGRGHGTALTARPVCGDQPARQEGEGQGSVNGLRTKVHKPQAQLCFFLKPHTLTVTALTFPHAKVRESKKIQQF